MTKMNGRVTRPRHLWDLFFLDPARLSAFSSRWPSRKRGVVLQP